MIYTAINQRVAKEAGPYHFLKKEIERIFGQRIITSKECLMLAEEIYNKTSVLINFNTIRRFFGLVKAKYPASNATINILSTYCGFNSIEDLVEAGKARTQTEENENNSNLLKYLVMIFKGTVINESNDETFNSFVKITIEYLSGNDGLMRLLQNEIVKTKNGKRFYFEKNINFDKLTSYYGDGLLNYLEESYCDEEKIFALSLLCLRDWLVKDMVSLAGNFAKMQALDITNSAPPFIWAWYMSSALLHAENYNINADELLHNAYVYHEYCKGKNSPLRVSQSFEYIYANALVLTGNYCHALHYIDYVLGNYTELYSPESAHCLQKLLLLKAISLTKLKDTSEAKKIYNLLKPSKFYVLSTKFDTALYLMLTKVINKDNKQTDEQLNNIIEETGFCRLQHLTYNQV